MLRKFKETEEEHQMGDNVGQSHKLERPEVTIEEPIQDDEIPTIFNSTDSESHLLYEEYLRPYILSQEQNIHQHAAIVQDGLPSYENLSFYKSYVCAHDFEKRIPRWTIHELHSGFLNEEAKADRSHSYFNAKIPGNIPRHVKASNDSYFRSGYSRGHLVPAGDMKPRTQDEMDETFLLNSNIVPQDYKNNANFWYRMEHFAKAILTQEFKTVRVMSGPLFLPQQREVKDFRGNPKTEEIMQYKLIGKKHVAVPTHLFKVVLCEPHPESGIDKKLLAAFVVPNEDIPSSKKLVDFQVPPSFIEERSGLHIYPLLKEREGFADLCKHEVEYCQMLAGRDWIIHDLHRKLSWNYDDDSKLTDVYNKLKDLDGLTEDTEKLYRKRVEQLELMRKYQKPLIEHPHSEDDKDNKSPVSKTTTKEVEKTAPAGADVLTAKKVEGSDEKVKPLRL
eukprot:CAMPEP_0117446112 /NCGR_PEP_ID=MMETSP0759-20121206/6157_1 /TAXON_ID=63605 /ORGANISM="Percolomonas cosmopolitus, Strain WS" /LENGTH=447 /DNA_ID=CAMNT_0005238337 /DNA_START=211 /DNA_END=1554 /DNA_ORIENTATION=-